MKIFYFPLGYLLRYRRHFICVLTSSIVGAGLSILTTYMLGRYLDSIASEQFDAVVRFTLVIVALYVAELSVGYFSQTSNKKLLTKATFSLCFDLIQKLPLFFFRDKDVAYLSQRLNSDTDSLVSFTQNNIIAIIVKTATLSIVLLLLLRMNARLTLVLLPLIPLYIIQYCHFKKPLYKSNYAVREQLSQYFAETNNQISNIKFVKLNILFDILNKTMQEKFGVLYAIQINNTKLLYYFNSGGSVIRYAMMIVLFMYGGYLIIHKQLTIGDFVVFNNYFGIMMGCTTYFLSLGQEYQNAKVSYTRIREILDTEKEINGNVLVDEISRIEARNIEFGYNGYLIIKDKNLIFEKGKIYCIKGDNGTGKSTLLAIILGLYNGHFQGEVLYNGISISELDLYELRKKVIGVSEQEPFLLQASIFENICPSYDGAKPESEAKKITVMDYIQTLRLNDFVIKQPEGLEYRIDGRTSNLSGGEKQKISQIRALIRKPQLLVLDEPTSALDRESIEGLRNILLAEKKERITIVITHHGDFSNIADEIINL